MRLLINASNLHHGGGVAVASSVLDELSRMTPGDDITVLASTHVDRNLTALGSNTQSFEAYHRFDSRGWRALHQRLPVRPQDFDAVLNVFGPSYSLALARGSITGFAQPWIAFPENLAASKLTLTQRSRTRARMFATSLFFRLSSVLVVEQEAVRQGLRRQRLFRRTPIEVVPSVVDSVFSDPTRWEDVAIPRRADQLVLGVIARNYPHKNLDILPEVKRILQTEHGVTAQFCVTFDDEEWNAVSPEFRSAIDNVGPLRLTQCPSFYAQLDGVVFPTLLECFSATPIEAQMVGTPLFASDISVVRETVGDYADYFDPLDPYDIASVVAHGLLRRRNHPGEPDSASRRRDYTSADRAARLVEISRARSRRPARARDAPGRERMEGRSV